jgi:hypothetical protein
VCAQATPEASRESKFREGEMLAKASAHAMNEIGGMPRRVFTYSAAFHLAVVLTLYGLVHWHLFNRPIPEETPIVVQLVNLAPETRATQVTRTPPKPKKPEDVAQVEAPKRPKPEPAKPERPKPPPQEATAEVPEPEPPKTAPPPAKPAPPKKKKDDADFDALLKNLAKNDPAGPVETPKQTAKRASSQSVAPFGSHLTTSELDLVKQQIEACWNPPAGARDAKDLTPEFRVYMNQDGTIRSASQLNPERNSDPFFQAASDSALRALRSPRCQPLKLPPEKYDQWQTFTITFDPTDLL